MFFIGMLLTTSYSARTVLIADVATLYMERVAVARIADVATRLSKRVSSMKKNVEIVATAVK